jgi:hypothetical protein
MTVPVRERGRGVNEGSCAHRAYLDPDEMT